VSIARSVTNHNESSASGSTIAVVLNSIPANSHVVLSVGCLDAQTISGVADDLSVAATGPDKEIDDAGNTLRKAVWHYENYGGGNRTFTVTFSAAVTFRSIVAMAYTGVATSSSKDGIAGQEATGASLTSTNLSPAPSLDGELIVGIGIASSGVPTPVSPLAEVFSNTVDGSDTSDYIQPTHAAFAAQWTQSGASDYGALAVSFFPAASSATVTGAPLLSQAFHPPRQLKGVLSMLMRAMADGLNRTSVTPVTVTIRQRKTLSPTGNHVGGRQRRN